MIECNPSPVGYECELEEDHAGPCKVFVGDPDEESWWGSPRRDRDGTGKKNDKGKPRMSLVHQPTLWGLITVLEHGAAKYGAFNYRDVVDGRDRYYDAVHRHLASWKQGEKLDKESGLKHLHHAIASLFFLSEMDNES